MHRYFPAIDVSPRIRNMHGVEISHCVYFAQHQLPKTSAITNKPRCSGATVFSLLQHQWWIGDESEISVRVLRTYTDVYKILCWFAGELRCVNPQTQQGCEIWFTKEEGNVRYGSLRRKGYLRYAPHGKTEQHKLNRTLPWHSCLSAWPWVCGGCWILIPGHKANKNPGTN